MTCYVFTFSRCVTSWKVILQSITVLFIIEITVLFIIEIEYMTLLEGDFAIHYCLVYNRD